MRFTHEDDEFAGRQRRLASRARRARVNALRLREAEDEMLAWRRGDWDRDDWDGSVVFAQ